MLQKKDDRLSEQRKFGIYYDDEYDYLQHLKDVNELNDVGIVEHFRISADQVISISVQLWSSVEQFNFMRICNVKAHDVICVICMQWSCK